MAASLDSEHKSQSSSLLCERLPALSVPLQTVKMTGNGHCLYLDCSQQTIARLTVLGMKCWLDMRMEAAAWIQDHATYPVVLPGHSTTPLHDYLDPINIMLADQMTEFKSMDVQAQRAYETQMKATIPDDPESACQK